MSVCVCVCLCVAAAAMFTATTPTERRTRGGPNAFVNRCDADPAAKSDGTAATSVASITRLLPNSSRLESLGNRSGCLVMGPKASTESVNVWEMRCWGLARWAGSCRTWDTFNATCFRRVRFIVTSPSCQSDATRGETKHTALLTARGPADACVYACVRVCVRAQKQKCCSPTHRCLPFLERIVHWLLLSRQAVGDLHTTTRVALRRRGARRACKLQTPCEAQPATQTHNHTAADTGTETLTQPLPQRQCHSHGHRDADTKTRHTAAATQAQSKVGMTHLLVLASGAPRCSPGWHW